TPCRLALRGSRERRFNRFFDWRIELAIAPPFIIQSEEEIRSEARRRRTRVRFRCAPRYHPLAEDSGELGQERKIGRIRKERRIDRDALCAEHVVDLVNDSIVFPSRLEVR